LFWDDGGAGLSLSLSMFIVWFKDGHNSANDPKWWYWKQRYYAGPDYPCPTLTVDFDHIGSVNTLGLSSAGFLLQSRSEPGRCWYSRHYDHEFV
jgi:hypothetical protein